MFEHSLIDLEEKKRPRRRWAPLPIAVGLHVAVLASVALGEVWNVAEVGDPDLMATYHVVTLPPPPPPLSGGRPARTTAVTAPVTPPKTPVQPDTAEFPDLEPAAPAPATLGAADLPFVEGGSHLGSPDGVQGGVLLGQDGGDVHSQGSIGWDGPAVAPEPRDEILRFNGSMTRPKQISGRQPRFTELARRSGTQGSVILEAVIDERGRVRDVRILKGLPMGLDQEAVAAVRDWVFEPARLGERPVKVYYTLTVHFEIQR